jgi:hypothetical protein
MRSTPRERSGLVAAGVAFLAALVAPFRILFRADLAGPLGAIPPLVPELLVPLLAPGLAVVAGGWLAAESRAVGHVAVAVGVGGGAAVGYPVGLVLGPSLLAASVGDPTLRTDFATSFTAEVYVVGIAPIAVATAVGVLAGAEWTRRPDVPAESLDRGDLGILAVVVGCGLLAGVSVVFHQAATIAQSLDPGFLVSSRWTVLTATGHVLLASVVVPLVAMFGGWVGSDHLDRVVARATVAASLVATAVGMSVGYLVAITLGREIVGWYLRGSLPLLLVDGITVATVLTLATLVGVALSPSRRAASGPAAA